MSVPYVIERPQPAQRPVLDPQQQAVLDHPGGPLLVLAGPGTGKTTTVVETVVERIETRGMDPDSILVLTFSRKAAHELRARIAGRLSRTTTGSPAMTFHSFCYALVREHSDPQDWQDPVRLMSAPEQHAVITELVSSHDPRGWPEHIRPALGTRGFASELAELMSAAAAQGIDAPRLRSIAQRAGRQDWLRAAEFFDEYRDVTALQNTTDYSDIVLQASRIAAEEHDTLRGRFELIIVDEYQDTDPLQTALLHNLAGDGGDLIVVGDPDQSIYGFRGADARAITDFPRDFGVGGTPADIIALPTTRRFGRDILEATRHIMRSSVPVGGIGMDSVRALRELTSVRPDPGIAQVRRCESRSAEHQYIAAELRRAHLIDGIDYADMAVLMRTGEQLSDLQRALSASHVPVEVAGDEIPLAGEPAVRALLSAVEIAQHLADDVPLDPAAVIDVLHGPLGRVDAAAMRRVLRALRHADRDRPGGPLASQRLLAEAIRHRTNLTVSGASGPLVAALNDVRALADLLHRAAEAISARQAPENVLWILWDGTSWPQNLWRDSQAPDTESVRANHDLDAVCALFDRAAVSEERQSRRTVANLIAELRTQQIPGDTLSDIGTRRPAVRLMTAHRSKGLEFSLVIVAGVQEGVWPNMRYRGSLLHAERLTPDGPAHPPSMSTTLAEERRLFYVACTRAVDRLVVTAVQSPADDGDQPSRFVLSLAESRAVDAPPEPQARAGRPYTLRGAVAGLRRLAEGSPSASVRSQAAHRLAHISRAPGADPQTWWALADLTRADTPITDPNAPVPLSGSTVSGIDECPLRWFYRHEARGSVPQTTAQGFGSLVHALAAAVVEGELPNDAAALETKLDEMWHRLEYPARWLKEREHDEAREAIERFTRWHAAHGNTVVAAEHGFAVTFDIDTTPVTLRGSMDRVELDADGRVVVIDLKTSKTAPGKEQVAEHPQLGVYQVAVHYGGTGEVAPGATNGGASLVQLRIPWGAKAPDDPKVQKQAALDDDSPAWQQVSAAAGHIRREDFPATPSPDLCRTCEFRAACPAQPEGAWIIGGHS